MSIIVSNGNATTSTPIEVHGQIRPILGPVLGPEQFAVTVKVRDTYLRDAFYRAGIAGFDGKEQPFVIAPTPDGKWAEFPMEYKDTSSLYPARTATDIYEVTLDPSQVDMERAKKLGYAVGMHTNVGDAWGQTGYGDNFKPSLW